MTESPFDVEWHDDSGNLLPWGPQPEEPALAYQYFCLYRSLGPGRSIAAAAREAGKPKDFFKELSPRWNWVDRCQAYDMWVERKAVAELVQGRAGMRAEHVAIADLAKAKIIARLKTLDPEELSPRDLATWLDLTTKIERQARGEADKTLKIEGQIDIVDQLPAHERAELMRQALSALNSRLGIRNDPPEIEGVIEGEVLDGGEEGGQG